MMAFLNSFDPTKAVATSRAALQSMIQAFYTFPKLLICVVNGPCIGIAATTAFLCDVIYVVDTVSVTFNKFLLLNFFCK